MYVVSPVCKLSPTVGDILNEMSNPVFWEKQEKISAELDLAQSGKVNYCW